GPASQNGLLEGDFRDWSADRRLDYEHRAGTCTRRRLGQAATYSPPGARNAQRSWTFAVEGGLDVDAEVPIRAAIGEIDSVLTVDVVASRFAVDVGACSAGCEFKNWPGARDLNPGQFSPGVFECFQFDLLHPAGLHGND